MEVVSKHGGARVRFPPPFVYLATLGGGLAIHYGVRAVAIPLATTPRVVIGIGVALAGIAMAIAARTWFRRTGQSPVPWTPSPELLVHGIYAYTRNPMYVGVTLLEVGIGVALGIAWIVLFAPIALAIVHVIAVRPEEAYLAHQFGDAYARYKASVRRYL